MMSVNLLPTIIAFSGQKGSGKNTIASFAHDYWVKCKRPRGGSIGVFAFADGIKEFCIDILGLEHRQCYGTDEEKNTPTQYRWPDTGEWAGSDFPPRMTGREVMQIFGTECVRNWFGNVWAEATVRRIYKRQLTLALITDNRFPNEVEVILAQPKGYIVRLTRAPYAGSDSHPSETALDDFNWDRPKCFVLDNAHMTKAEQKQAMVPILEDIFDRD